MFAAIMPLMQVMAKSGAECGHSFLGMVPWYQYLTLDDDCGVTDFTVLGSGSDLPLVILAIVQDLITIAGLIAVIFVVYGGVMYITSQGNPDQTSKAQSTIINAVAGLVVAVVAVVFVSFLGNRLG
jgi:hypothetical protein